MVQHPKPRARKISALDRFEAEQMAKATSFILCFRIKGQFLTHACSSLDDAQDLAKLWDKEHGGSGRRAMIYAMCPDGQQLPVGAKYLNADQRKARARRGV